MGRAALPKDGGAGQPVILDRSLGVRIDHPSDQIAARAGRHGTESISQELGILGIERGRCIYRDLDVEIGLLANILGGEFRARRTNPVKPYLYRLVLGASGAARTAGTNLDLGLRSRHAVDCYR